jgi:hypothetical protein
MNLGPGGKQAVMRTTSFQCNGETICQPMVFPMDHADPQLRGKQKGVKQALVERNLWRNGLTLRCKTGECNEEHTCCASAILGNQPDFLSQKSLVQEVIERHGHLCLFFPKYHCEMNFIEFFWGATKKYLRDNCDYTFEGLKARLPAAMESVQLHIIRRWSNRMWRWVEAYDTGLSCQDAQRKVRNSSSYKYKSHRRPTERLGALLDQS